MFRRAIDWIEQNPIYKLLAIVGAVAGAVAIVPQVMPSTWFGDKPAVQAPSSKPAEKSRGPIRTTLSDGRAVTISPSYETRILPDEAVLFYTELNNMENAQAILAAAVKRHVLRKIAGFNLQEILVLRSDIEDTILKALQAEMTPRGMRVLAFSLGEIGSR